MAAKTKTHEPIHRPGMPRDEIRAALKGIAKDLHAGGRDLYADVEKFAHSARRDAVKLGKALGGDVQRLAKAPGASSPPPRAPRHAAPAARRRTIAPHPGKKAAA